MTSLSSICAKAKYRSTIFVAAFPAAVSSISLVLLSAVWSALADRVDEFFNESSAVVGNQTALSGHWSVGL